MKKILLVIMIMVNLYGWETNTHRAIENAKGQKSQRLLAFSVQHSVCREGV